MKYRSLFTLVLSLLLYIEATPIAHSTAVPGKSLRNLPRRNYNGGVVELTGIIYSVVNGYRPLRMDLFLPSRGKAPYPAVVFIHGGGWVVDPGEADRLGGSAVMAKLAARGFVVARVSYRLSSEAKFPAQLTDVKTAIRWLRTQAALYKIDPQHVAVWGASAGGYLSAMVATSCQVKSFEVVAALPQRAGLTTPSIDPDVNSCVQAAVDWYGPIDFASMDSQALPNSMSKHDDPQSAESQLLGCAIPQCSAELLKQANPLTYIEANSAPFLIMHGSSDHSVPYQQSQQLYDALRAKDVAAQLILIKNADHMFNGISVEQAQAQLDTVFKFLDERLKKVVTH